MLYPRTNQKYFFKYKLNKRIYYKKLLQYKKEYFIEIYEKQIF
jgi:hypothetical protein